MNLQKMSRADSEPDPWLSQCFDDVAIADCSRQVVREFQKKAVLRFRYRSREVSLGNDRVLLRVRKLIEEADSVGHHERAALCALSVAGDAEALAIVWDEQNDQEPGLLELRSILDELDFLRAERDQLAIEGEQLLHLYSQVSAQSFRTPVPDPFSSRRELVGSLERTGPPAAPVYVPNSLGYVTGNAA
ncbi:MAG: hypothetical protein F2806_03960 [Actinobacteria bacterium]|uniref:Unannotated protein n=1 Tax=freshwater metagenome TaxID=449393 RepID=A0A6J7FQL3_9ZZZZ|nr:hypothetical protein [Actinomycetota bacterium]